MLIIVSCKKPDCPTPVPNSGSVNDNLEIGLMGHYPFTGNPGDSSGLSNDGTVFNAILTTDRFGNSNRAYSFNGSNSYISLPPADFLNSNYTYSMWVKAASLPVSSNGYTLLSIGNTAGDQTLTLGNNLSTLGWAAASYNIGGTNEFFGVGSLPTLNIWYYVVSTRDKSNLKLYVNGILTGSVPVVGLTEYTSPSIANIGARYSMSTYFDGFIDDVRIYSRALSGSEVSKLYQLK